MPLLILLKSKTIWASLAAIATAGVAYSTGDMSGADAIQTAFTGIIGTFLRLGIGFGK